LSGPFLASAKLMPACYVARMDAPAWMRPLRPLLRGASATGEQTPGLRGFGVSQWILATRTEPGA